jgi:CDP-diacylglycerol--glycerol-3-phosphate 3-phosphatidyltransferase
VTGAAHHADQTEPRHPTPPAPTFGPSALATPANAITLGRLLLTPLFIALIVVQGATWWTVVVGLVVAGSDGVDGWLARRQGSTRSGAFLDPLADKVVVLSAMFTLVAQGVLPWFPVALIAAREVGMTIYRSWVGRRGVSIPARFSAKVKTLVQDLAIATCLLPPLAHRTTLQRWSIWIAAILTVVTGVQYLLDGRRALRTAGVDGAAPRGPA